jgi:hypothetical protein
VTGPDAPPGGWSYTAPAAPRRRISRRIVVIAAIVVVVLVAGLVTWLVWPSKPSQAADADTPVIKKSMLNDKPPTVILNGLDFRSLYPPGYVDFDSSKSGDSGVDYDPDADYDTKTEPEGCEYDPLFARMLNFINPKDADEYDRYPIHLLMYPVDDPGGAKEDSRGFSVQISPSEDPTSLNYLRDWAKRCNGAKETTTTTKNGQVIKQETSTRDVGYTEAPASDAADGLERTSKGKPSCDFVGLVRGMVVEVSCPPNQRDAGVNLYRTVIRRIGEL